MKIFNVSYDLRNQRDYDSLYDRLNKLGGKRVLESMWTLKLDDSVNSGMVRDDLKRFMDSDDGIFVAEMKSYAWNNLDNNPHRWD